MESNRVPELTNANGVVRIAILISSLPDGTSQGVSAGLILPEGINEQQILNTLNGLPETPSLNDLDKFLTLQPIEEGRPHHSNLQNFSQQTSDGITIDQDGTAPDDFIEVIYDNRSGSASPNDKVFMLTTEGIINAYTPQMQMEEVDAIDDLPDTPRKTLIMTDNEGRRVEGALFIDPAEPKIILLLESCLLYTSDAADE